MVGGREGRGVIGGRRVMGVERVVGFVGQGGRECCGIRRGREGRGGWEFRGGRRVEDSAGWGDRRASGLTWVFPTATPLDEADDEQDQNDEGDGTHQADEPALGRNVHLVYVGCRWGGARGKRKRESK